MVNLTGFEPGSSCVEATALPAVPELLLSSVNDFVLDYKMPDAIL